MKDRELILLLGTPQQAKMNAEGMCTALCWAASLGSCVSLTQDRQPGMVVTLRPPPALTAVQPGFCPPTLSWNCSPKGHLHLQWPHRRTALGPLPAVALCRTCRFLLEELDCWFTLLPRSPVPSLTTCKGDVWLSSFFSLTDLLLSADIYSSDLLPWASFKSHLQQTAN